MRKRYFLEVVENNNLVTYTFFDFFEAIKKEDEIKSQTNSYKFYWRYSDL